MTGEGGRQAASGTWTSSMLPWSLPMMP